MASEPAAPRPHGARTVVITGASSGIGAAGAALFAQAGDRVVVVGRSAQRTREVAERIGGTPLTADFERLGQVRELAAALLELCPRIDVLASNAGGTWPRARVTEDGFERTMQVNHLAPFLLTSLLRERLVESSARVIATSSVAHRAGRLPRDTDALPAALRATRPYVSTLAYGRSKLANILHMRELQRRSAPSGLVAVSFHPGIVASQFGRDGGLTGALVALPVARARMTTSEQAALRLQLLADAPVDGEGRTGPLPGQYHDGTTGAHAPGRASRAARDDVLAPRLWDASARVLGLGEPRDWQ
jgi:NAD(P)-dependent dehydrogenase (short-subunit alcohol dehydrogenase family)